jgi:hypothetical protein
VTGSHTTVDDAELGRRYTEYLERFAREVGELEVGAFAKHAGHLIRKLSLKGFTEADAGYRQLLAQYHDSLARGDTINNIVLKLVRELAANLVLPAPTL